MEPNYTKEAKTEPGFQMKLDEPQIIWRVAIAALSTGYKRESKLSCL